jgi:pimeloyl-ACP methyl ester carboxylesterase
VRQMIAKMRRTAGGLAMACCHSVSRARRRRPQIQSAGHIRDSATKLGLSQAHWTEDETVEQFVDVAGRKIWTRTVGHGPAVVLCSGAGAASVGSWPEVEGGAARFATVVTYDRAGTGRSEAPDISPTADDMAEELTLLLNSLAVKGPVILVGFSMAAFLVQLFACRLPAEVVGLILLDPLPDELLAQLADQPPAVRASLRAKTADTSSGLVLESEKSIESAVQVRDALLEAACPMSR